ncbi:hypothetical protein ACOSP7_023166 [Xanthoceras sorbifolium]
MEIEAPSPTAILSPSFIFISGDGGSISHRDFFAGPNSRVAVVVLVGRITRRRVPSATVSPARSFPPHHPIDPYQYWNECFLGHSPTTTTSASFSVCGSLSLLS